MQKTDDRFKTTHQRMFSPQNNPGINTTPQFLTPVRKGARMSRASNGTVTEGIYWAGGYHRGRTVFKKTIDNIGKW